MASIRSITSPLEWVFLLVCQYSGNFLDGMSELVCSDDVRSLCIMIELIVLHGLPGITDRF